MVAVQVRYGDTFYIIGDFWEIVERLKAHRSYFRFRARRWRWPESLNALEMAMQPFEVREVALSEAQRLQLDYDRLHIAPTQEWVSGHTRLAQVSVEWWEAVKLKGKTDKRNEKLYQQHTQRIELALQAAQLPAADLDRDQTFSLQYARRIIEQYEPRIVKWLGERAKERRREELLTRFEREMGLSRAQLAEVEAERGPARLALYEELGGLEWQGPDITELKAAVRLLLKGVRSQKSA